MSARYVLKAFPKSLRFEPDPRDDGDVFLTWESSLTANVCETIAIISSKWSLLKVGGENMWTCEYLVQGRTTLVYYELRLAELVNAFRSHEVLHEGLCLKSFRYSDPNFVGLH